MPKSKEAFDYALALDEPPMYKVLLHNHGFCSNGTEKNIS